MIIKIPSLNIPHKVYIQRRYNFISISSPALLQLRHATTLCCQLHIPD